MPLTEQARVFPEKVPAYQPSNEYRIYINAKYETTGKVKFITTKDNGLVTVVVEYADQAAKDEYLADPKVQAVVAERNAHYAQFKQ